MTHTVFGLDVTVSRLVFIYRGETHDVAALSGVDLTVEAGESIALLGPSGAGKSTLLNLVAGLVRPTAGTITIGGRRLDQLDDTSLDHFRSTTLGLIVQGAHRNLLPHLTVEQNIRVGTPAAATPRSTELLDMVGLPHTITTTRAQDLSATDAQLTALCVAMAAHPGLLLADEPTAALGPDGSATVIEALHRINHEHGTTILTVTHDHVLAAAMRRTITIRDGRVGAQARDGVEAAMIAPDGSLPLPDDILTTIPAGTLVSLHLDDSRHHRRFTVTAHPIDDPASPSEAP